MCILSLIFGKSKNSREIQKFLFSEFFFFIFAKNFAKKMISENFQE